MHIFFDVDYTILGRDSTLRPGTHEVFARLREDGHHVYVWSGEGVRWGVVRNHGLEHLVHGVYGKPLQDYENRLEEFGVPVVPDFVIDDYPGIVRAFGGVCITDYLGQFDGRDDRELETVYEIICAHHAGDMPDHPRYYPTPPTFPSSTGPSSTGPSSTGPSSTGPSSTGPSSSGPTPTGEAKPLT